MRKLLYFTSLGLFIISCSTQKSTQKAYPKAKSSSLQSNIKPPVPPKPSIYKDHGIEFYKDNISDKSRGDNTMSHGSIVSARPKGFSVKKTFFPAVAQNFRQKYVIVHYTALENDKSVTVLTQQAVSSHYLVNDKSDHEIDQLVDENKRAYHAGISSWRKDKNLNDTSIGIEIVNKGFTTDQNGQRTFYPFNDNQVEKVAALLKDIIERYQIPSTNILGHSDIAPGRKQDPGPLFPWKKLYDQYQIGMWYDDVTKTKYLNLINPETFAKEQSTSPFIFKVQTALQQFGYDISPSGIWDKENMKVVEALQYHFRPEKYDGVVDAETWAILQALNEKYPQK